MTDDERKKGKLEHFSARFSPGAKDRLKAMAHLEGETAYSLLEDAFWFWWDHHVPAEKRQVAENFTKAVAQMRKKRSKD